jgi:hypothetical protein
MDDERFCTRCGENVSNIMPGTGSGDSPAGPDNSFGRNDGYVSPYAQNVNQNAQPGQGGPGAQPGQGAGGYNPPPYNPQPYAQPVYRPADDEMSLGKWVGTIVVTTFFGIISLIFLFVWGFGDGPECRKRYCKAMLITMLIGLGVGIIFTIIFFSIMSSYITNSLSDYLRDYQNYRYDFSQFTAALFG